MGTVPSEPLTIPVWALRDRRLTASDRILIAGLIINPNASRVWLAHLAGYEHPDSISHKVRRLEELGIVRRTEGECPTCGSTRFGKNVVVIPQQFGGGLA